VDEGAECLVYLGGYSFISAISPTHLSEATHWITCSMASFLQMKWQ